MTAIYHRVLIDTADDGSGAPMAGLDSLDGSAVYYSMERNAIPKRGRCQFVAYDFCRYQRVF